MKDFMKKNARALFFLLIGVAIAIPVAYCTEILYDSANVGYDNTTSQMNATTVQTAIDELKTRKDSIVSYTGLLLGDYFTMVPDASTFTIKAGTTGYSSDQTITPNELTLWRVIDIHNDGSVDAVSEYVSSTGVYFNGVTGFANFVGGLQTIAAQYAKSGYTIDTRMMGYGGQTATIQPKSSTCTGTCQTTTTYAFDGTTNTVPGTTTLSPETGTGKEYSGGVLGDTLYLKDIQLVGNVYKTDTITYGIRGLKAYKVDDTTTSGNYWLASRQFSRNTTTDFLFYGRATHSGSLGGSYLRRFNGSWSDVPRSFFLRPIITLKSGIQISGGSGTKGNPYTITAS